MNARTRCIGTTNREQGRVQPPRARIRPYRAGGPRNSELAIDVTMSAYYRNEHKDGKTLCRQPFLNVTPRGPLSPPPILMQRTVFPRSYCNPVKNRKWVGQPTNNRATNSPFATFAVLGPSRRRPVCPYYPDAAAKGWRWRQPGHASGLTSVATPCLTRSPISLWVPSAPLYYSFSCPAAAHAAYLPQKRLAWVEETDIFPLAVDGGTGNTKTWAGLTTADGDLIAPLPGCARSGDIYPYSTLPARA